MSSPTEHLLALLLMTEGVTHVEVMPSMVVIHYPTFARVLTIAEARERAKRVVRRMKAA